MKHALATSWREEFNPSSGTRDRIREVSWGYDIFSGRYTECVRVLDLAGRDLNNEELAQDARNKNLDWRRAIRRQGP